MYAHVSKIVSLNLVTLNKLCDDTSHANLKLNPREWSVLGELVSTLKPFYEVTIATQGDKVGFVYKINNYVICDLCRPVMCHIPFLYYIE